MLEKHNDTLMNYPETYIICTYKLQKELINFIEHSMQSEFKEHEKAKGKSKIYYQGRYDALADLKQLIETVKKDWEKTYIDIKPESKMTRFETTRLKNLINHTAITFILGGILGWFIGRR